MQLYSHQRSQENCFVSGSAHERFYLVTPSPFLLQSTRKFEILHPCVADTTLIRTKRFTSSFVRLLFLNLSNVQYFAHVSVYVILKITVPSTDLTLQIPQLARCTFNCSGKESTQSCGFCYDTVFVEVE